MTDKKYTDILSLILRYSQKPPLFEPGEARFWDDPHISKSMLEAHLNPDHDAASRRPDTIDREVEHLVSSGTLRPGDRVLDLGCGPGLYASRLAGKGMKVTGVDISQRSLNYAIAQAKEQGLDIDYRCMNFFDIDYSGDFDAAIQTHGEMCTFPDAKRDELFAKIHQTLKPDGLFIFDVTTRAQRAKAGKQNGWYASDGGFWRSGTHLVLEQGFDYSEDNVWLDQYTVVDEEKISVYRNWFHDHTLQSIRQALQNTGFVIVNVWNDLAGTPYEEGGDWIAIVSQRSKIRPVNDATVDYKDLVRRSYDRLAAEYEEKRQAEPPAVIHLLTDRLSDGANVLDIGCGVGIPVAHTLARRFKVTGVDISGGMINRALANDIDATFIHGDIMSVELPPASFDAATAFYSIFHLPREEHPDLLRRIYGWLKPGGYLLATFSYCNDAPYTDDYFGVTMYWSNYGLEEYDKMLGETGFKILEIGAVGAGYKDPGEAPGERHPLILAQTSPAKAE